jgi:hypothetical protein
MNRIKNLIAITALSLLVLGLPAIASAQYRDRDDDDYNRRNGGYYGNGQYGQYGQYGDMRSIVRSLKNRTKDFQRELDRDLDRSRYNGTYEEDEINDLVKDFRSAVYDLDNNDRQNSNEVNRVLDLGRQVDRVVYRMRLGYNTENLWQAIRNDLDALGNYGYDNRNNRRNRNGGWNNGRWGKGGVNKPSWWPF